MQFIKRMRIVPVDEGVYLLLNGVTGTIDLIDEKVYQLYLKWKDEKEICPDNENKEIYHSFLNRGYILKPDEEEKRINDLYDRLDKSLNKIKPRVDPTLVLTYDCNFRCSYCYEKNLLHYGKEEIKRRMTVEQVKGLFESFIEMGMDIGDVTLYGGEPLMLENKSLVKEILQLAKRHNLGVQVISNGYTMETYAPILATAKITKLQITLDGNEKRHNRTRFTVNGEGTYKEILKGLVTARKYNLPILLRCNVNVREKEDQARNVIESLEAYGLNKDPGLELYIAPVTDYNKCGYDNDFLKNYLQKIDQYIDSPILMKEVLTRIHHIALNFLDKSRWKPKYVYCSAHIGQQVFDPWGYIYPCQAMVGDKDGAIGTFDEKGIYYKENYTIWQNRTVKNIPTCRECAMALFCGGGCAWIALRDSGDINQPNCAQMNELWDVFLPYLYNRYLKESIS